MYKRVTINGKELRIDITPEARSALAARGSPLVAEMELYFSCLVRKKVRFHEVAKDADSETVPVSEQLCVRFRPVMTQSCSVGDVEEDEPPRDRFSHHQPHSLCPPLASPGLPQRGVARRVRLPGAMTGRYDVPSTRWRVFSEQV